MRQMNLPYPQQEELYRRMVFNVMSRNHDDHSKNFSFLMDKQGKWKLSPAYDLCYSYTPGGKWTNRHQLSLNGKQDNFTMEDLQKWERTWVSGNTNRLSKRYRKPYRTSLKQPRIAGSNRNTLILSEKICSCSVSNRIRSKCRILSTNKNRPS